MWPIERQAYSDSKGLWEPIGVWGPTEALKALDGAVSDPVAVLGDLSRGHYQTIGQYTYRVSPGAVQKGGCCGN